jgi:ketosteroid isomerase-like protein
MFRSILMTALILTVVSISVFADDKREINTTLDSLHRHASTADWNEYFELYTKDAVFIGTDVTERWDIPTFKGYAAGAKNGWTYTPRERHIDLTPDGNSAWFDEILDSENYGTSRGTGILVKTQKGWKIAQYHLTFPIPNALAGNFTAKIKEYEASLDQD